MNELMQVIPFYFVFFLFGIIGYALAVRFTNKKSILTYIIAKPLGLLIFAYPLWLLTSMKVVAYNNQGLLMLLFMLAVIGSGIALFRYAKSRTETKDTKGKIQERAFFDKKFLLRILAVEVLSLVLLFGYSYIRSFSPALESTEKFMDLHLLMSAGKTDYFPFFDGWWSTKVVNYYYYGFYIFSLLIRISGVPYAVGYNLSLGIILVCAVLISFAIIYRLTKSRLFSILGAGLLSVAGNLHYATCYFQNSGPDLSTKCYYPKATRILDPSFTINEFPSYSFILGDLHPHVMSIPFFLTNLYLLTLVYRSKKLNPYLYSAYFVSLATTAMINFWDFVTLGFLFALVFFRKMYLRVKKERQKKDETFNDFTKRLIFKHKNLLIWTLAFAASPFVLFLPFFLHFKSPVTGIGFAPQYVNAHPNVPDFQYPSTFWFLFGIWGFYIIIGILGILATWVLDTEKTRKLLLPTYLFGTGLLLIVVTELFFFQDLFHIANPAYFRANTVFKFGYHAWMLLSLSSAVFLYFIWKRISRIKKPIFGIAADFTYIGLLLAFSYTVFLYPFIAVNQAYAPSMPWNLESKPFFTLDGSKYIEARNNDDYRTIKWLNENQKNRVVVLEAVGSSYSYFGRIGVNTGMGNPVNWESHQWTWRFHYPDHISSWKQSLGQVIDTGYGEVAKASTDVKTMYESSDTNEVKRLFDTYKVKYVYIGEQERITYPNIDEEKFDSLGTVVFTSGLSKLYRVH
jgi:uncharacterized membrane protein